MRAWHSYHSPFSIKKGGKQWVEVSKVLWRDQWKPSKIYFGLLEPRTTLEWRPNVDGWCCDGWSGCGYWGLVEAMYWRPLEEREVLRSMGNTLKELGTRGLGQWGVQDGEQGCTQIGTNQKDVTRRRTWRLALLGQQKWRVGNCKVPNSPTEMGSWQLQSAK